MHNSINNNISESECVCVRVREYLLPERLEPADDPLASPLRVGAEPAGMGAHHGHIGWWLGHIVAHHASILTVLAGTSGPGFGRTLTQGSLLACAANPAQVKRSLSGAKETHWTSLRHSTKVMGREKAREKEWE